MFSTTKFCVYVTKAEQEAINNLINILDNSCIELNDYEYVSIFRTIYNKENYVDEIDSEDNEVYIEYTDYLR